MRPFDPAPDLSRDTQLLADFMSRGMEAFPPLVAGFGLEADQEGALLLGIALQGYARGDLELATRNLAEFTARPGRLAVFSRAFEVLYKTITTGFMAASSHWVQLALDTFMRHPGEPEAQRAAVEFFTYFGLWRHAEALLGQLPDAPFAPWRAHIAARQALLRDYAPRCRFSFVLITWNRAGLLDSCLGQIRDRAGDADHEIIVGVNGSTDHTAEVLARHGIDKVFRNPVNDSVDYYRTVFDAAGGDIVIEIDDNVTELPEAFDLILEKHLQCFPECGFIGFEPIRRDGATGPETPMQAAPDSQYQPIARDGLVLHAGPVWGCCAALRRRDFLDFGGFYGVRMSKTLGEEPQILRKLRLHGRKGGLVKGARLVKTFL